MVKAQVVDEWHRIGENPKGIKVTLDSDGGVTIHTPSGIVLSIIDRSEGMRPDEPGFEPFVSIESYPYAISTKAIGMLEVPATQLRNPRTRVVRYWVEALAPAEVS